MDKEYYRAIDKKIEREINRFNDKHMYGKNILFKRCYNNTLQVQGIDGYISIPLLNIYSQPCDEKASGHYVNRMIKTYLMELSQIKMNGEIVDGWFLNGECQTEYYNLMFIYAEVPQTIKNGKVNAEWQKITSHNINIIEYFIVKKSKIFDYLKQCGFDKERLRKACEYLRNNESIDKVETKYGFKFVISRSFKEEPVNLCINREVYLQICDMHGYTNRYDAGV